VARNPLKKSDADLQAELVELREEERAFRKEHARLRENVHAGVEVSLAAARVTFEREAQNARLAWGPDPRPTRELVELAVRWAVTQPGFAKALHEAIDADPGPVGMPSFSKLSKAQYEKEHSRLLKEIASHEYELRHRGATLRRLEADAELAGIEAEAAAVLGGSV